MVSLSLAWYSLLRYVACIGLGIVGKFANGSKSCKRLLDSTEFVPLQWMNGWIIVSFTPTPNHYSNTPPGLIMRQHGIYRGLSGHNYTDTTKRVEHSGRHTITRNSQANLNIMNAIDFKSPPIPR